MNKKVTLSLLSDYSVFEQCEQEGQSLCLAVSCVNNVNKKVSLSPCLAVCCLNSVNKKDTLPVWLLCEQCEQGCCLAVV